VKEISKAIVLLSGGQDSTTCLFWALSQFDEVEAVGFDYGQKHRRELVQAEIIAALADVPYQILNLQGLLSGSSLTDHNADINAPHAVNPDLPSSFTAGRNLLFLSAVASYAYHKNITNLVTGICQTDYSGYPDCRENFRAAAENAISLALNAPLKIHAPLMFLTKAETWKLARELSTGRFDVVEIVRELTLTDYNGNRTQNEWGLGNLDNPASVLRAKGYYEAKEKGWI
jgi:7-cyano-7-deazaguanine synthase